MDVTAPNEMTLADAAKAVATGALTSEALVQSCLDRIAEREPTVHAFAFLDPELALKQAHTCDAASDKSGPLHGVPVAIKDIIDTADMPTECNSPIYKGHIPTEDAACVKLLRAAGAVIMGKTVTTEFASSHPGPTTNPHNPAHTPGGSSQGSGASVADCMVPAALGTQTGGSVIRPNAYCGTVGYKPAYGLYDKTGVKPLSTSLDTIGFMTRSLTDIPLLSSVLADRAPVRVSVDGAPTLLLHRTAQWDQAETCVQELLEDCAGKLAAAGAPVRDHTFEPPYDNLQAVQRVLSPIEACRAFRREWTEHREGFSKSFQDMLMRGFETSAEAAGEAQGLLKHCREALPGMFQPGEIILTLGAPGEAPKGLASTGDSMFNRAWTFLGASCLYLPVTMGPQGLPIGIQLVEPHCDEARLLAAGHWCADTLGLDLGDPK
jgi:Asp-tRNA(Asn)/Glu-tRNA(Gln) amidotransferase A subunit family amidase